MSGPRAAAQSEGAAFEAPAPPVVRYRSAGAVLVTGPAGRALPVAAALGTTDGLRVVAVIDDLPADAKVPRRVTAVRGRVERLTGFLGRFSAEARARTGAISLAPLSPNRSGCFDVVVDLGEQPLCALEVEPPGYFRPAVGVVDTGALAAAITALSGETAKPRFVRYLETLCTHGAQSLTGCTRCLDACPAGALSSDGARIAVETGLCRGCASCTLACPTGALAFSAPRARDARARVRRMLGALAAAGAASPRILFHGAGDASRAAASRAAQADPDLLSVEMSTPAAAGADTWLAVLAMGAAQVLVLDDPALPATARRVLAAAVGDARGVLGAMGADAARLALVRAESPHGDGLAGDGGPPAAGERLVLRPLTDPGPGKREVLERAIAMLAPACAPPGRGALAAASAFGTVTVDGAACTFCLACARICPTRALASDAARAALLFTEAACVQCGLCAAACPEDAVALEAFFEPDPHARSDARVVHRADLAACARCGEPFLPRALLDASLARVGGTAAANAEVAAMLGVCPKCRSRAAMREPFIGGGGA